MIDQSAGALSAVHGRYEANKARERSRDQSRFEVEQKPGFCSTSGR